MRCLTAARVLKHNSTYAVKPIDGRDGGMDAARRGGETAKLEIRAQETAAEQYSAARFLLAPTLHRRQSDRFLASRRSCWAVQAVFYFVSAQRLCKAPDKLKAAIVANRIHYDAVVTVNQASTESFGWLRYLCERHT